jgi:hypothetical protein
MQLERHEVLPGLFVVLLHRRLKILCVGALALAKITLIREGVHKRRLSKVLRKRDFRL